MSFWYRNWTLIKYEFNQFRIWGLAIHSWPDGTKYEGYWKDDLQHDKGIEVKADGSSYNGEF